MISIKDTVYQTLRKVCENVSDVTVSDLSVLPFIRFLEEENKVNEWTDNKEQSTYVRYRIDLWDEADTTSLALAVDRQMTQEIGLVRMQCIDVADPLGIKQKNNPL